MEQDIKFKEEIKDYLLDNGFEFPFDSYFYKQFPFKSKLSVILRFNNTIRISFIIVDDNNPEKMYESVGIRLYEGEQFLDEVKHAIEKVTVWNKPPVEG